MYLLKEMLLEDRYLNFAVDSDAPPSLLRLEVDGIVLGEFEIRLAVEESDYWVYLDLNEYRGALLRIECNNRNGRIACAILQSGTITGREELYRENFRPQFHFTARRGRMGALTELQYKEGKWVLQYEHNPFGCDDSNPVAGRATSRDLVHWEESEENYMISQPTSVGKPGPLQNVELPVAGTSGGKKWVCFSGRGDYSIGQVEGGEYIQEGNTDRLWFGDEISTLICNPPSENRCIHLGAGLRRNVSEAPFCGQLLIPVELSLGYGPEGLTLFAAPIRELKNLRVWTRVVEGIELGHSNQLFTHHLDFRLAPGKWPDIRILPADGTHQDISSDLLEFILDLDVIEAEMLTVRICGIDISLDRVENTLNCRDVTVPLPCNEDHINLHIFLDKSSMEIFVGNGRTVMIMEVPPDKQTREVEVSCPKGSAAITSLEIFGLRGIWPTAAEARMIADALKDDSVLYKSEGYTVYGSRIEDAVYGEPPAFVPDRSAILSPTRAVEEFVWRKSQWGDMTRAVNRSNVWHPGYQVCNFPDIHSGYNTLDAAYRLALDILSRCAGDEFALSGEQGMWSAGFFQGTGEGFGVWVRDTTHTAIRTGNLLDPEGARHSLLFTTLSGFDNGVDGIGMPIVGICDYYLATGDVTLIKDTWSNLKGRIARLEERFDSSRGLIQAEQSTSNDAFPEPECGGFSLATEIYFMEAFRAMARMGRSLGEEEGLTGQWEAMGKLLLRNIRTQYWKESAGFFTSGPVGSESYEGGYWESAGQEMAVWPRYGIASREQRAKILERLSDVAMNEFGVNVFPYRKETNHFCNAAWVVWTAGMSAAAGREGALGLLMKLMAQQVRNSVINKTFYEVIDYHTGRAWRWPGQLWHAAGFLSYFYLGVLGMEYDESGLHLTPAVPEPLSGFRIDNFRYRKATVDIRVHGWGTQCRMLLDGTETDLLPAQMEGRHRIELFMAQP